MYGTIRATETSRSMIPRPRLTTCLDADFFLPFSIATSLTGLSFLREPLPYSF